VGCCHDGHVGLHSIDPKQQSAVRIGVAGTVKADEIELNREMLADLGDGEPDLSGPGLTVDEPDRRYWFD
jgi:hypothetical protein